MQGQPGTFWGRFPQYGTQRTKQVVLHLAHSTIAVATLLSLGGPVPFITCVCNNQNGRRFVFKGTTC